MRFHHLRFLSPCLRSGPFSLPACVPARPLSSLPGLSSLAPTVWSVLPENTGLCGSSLAVQYLRLCAPTSVGAGSVPGRGTKIPHAACSQNVQSKQNPPVFAKIQVSSFSWKAFRDLAFAYFRGVVSSSRGTRTLPSHRTELFVCSEMDRAVSFVHRLSHQEVFIGHLSGARTEAGAGETAMDGGE